VAARAGRDVDGPGRCGGEGEQLGRIGIAVRAERHRPDAVARVVGEEERAVVRRRVRAAAVEGEAGDRGAAGRARLAGDDLRAVVVRVERGDDGAARVQRLAQVEVRAVVARLPANTLVARPAEVLDGRVARVADLLDLLPRAPADVADPELRRAGPERDPERVAQPVRDDP